MTPRVNYSLGMLLLVVVESCVLQAIPILASAPVSPSNNPQLNSKAQPRQGKDNLGVPGANTRITTQRSEPMAILPAGVRIKLVLEDALSAGQSKAGDKFVLRVQDSVKDEAGHVVIEKDTVVPGIIVRSEARSGHRELRVKVESVEAVDGTLVPLRSLYGDLEWELNPRCRTNPFGLKSSCTCYVPHYSVKSGSVVEVRTAQQPQIQLSPGPVGDLGNHAKKEASKKNKTTRPKPRRQPITQPNIDLKN